MVGGVLYILTSGLLFFFGLFLIFLSLCASFRSKIVLHKSLRITFLLGLFSCAVSPPSLPIIALPAVLIIFLFSFIISSFESLAGKKTLKTGVLVLSVVVAIIMFIIEMPLNTTPHINLDSQKFFVLGDSLTAGIRGQGIKTWLGRINDSQRFEIIDLSRAGSRVRDGLSMITQIDDETLPIMIELGGNDWRSGQKTAQDYREDLEKLLSAVCTGDRTIIMFEIPFPPLEYNFLRYQRQLMKKYDVVVIPKKFLSSILFLHANSTTDGIHLSDSGHQLFADKLLDILS